MIFVTTMNSRIPKDAIEVNTTSRSNNWSRGLSPFFVGPIHLYDSYVAQNLENAWQFSKVYKQHVGEDGKPNAEYFKWAEAGWKDTYAHRYPMGKGAIPEYSWWVQYKLDYISARKTIYIPLYAEAVRETDAFDKLKNLVASNPEKDIYLRDFDGYNHKELGMTYEDVMNSRSRKMGHAFVLAMLLDEHISLTSEE